MFLGRARPLAEPGNVNKERLTLRVRPTRAEDGSRSRKDGDMRRKIAVFAFLLAVAAGSFAARTELPTGLNKETEPVKPVKPVVTWRKNLQEAKIFAGAEYRPIMALFTSPDCGWCKRLKNVVLTDPMVTDLLAEFSLVEIDVSSDRKTADLYQITGVPVILFLSADGEARKGVSGYVSAPELKKMLEESLNPAFLKSRSASYVELLRMLDDNQVLSNKWPEIMQEFSSPEKRKELQDRILKLSPFPRKDVVDLLKADQLAVRLGAIEIIEELTGKDWGYDPWQEESLVASNEASIARLQLWADQKEEPDARKAVYSALTKEQIVSYIQDLISTENERSVRAMRMLENGGGEVSGALVAFLAEHRDLPVGSRNRVKEVQYILALKGCGGLDASTVARKLLYGTLDVRMQTIASINVAGLRAVPVLKEFLEDPDPIIREAAVDTLVLAGGSYAVPVLKEHLKIEKDKDVIYTILKDLGNVQSSAGLDVLSLYLANPNEDLVVVALNSLAKRKSTKMSAEITNCLSDQRWRVRVAALEALGQLKLDSVSGRVAEMLGDPDAFVRFSAVKALTLISAKKAAPKLEETFLKEDELKAPVIAALISMDLPIPKAFEKAMEGKNPDVILSVIDALSDCNEKDLWFVEKYLDDENLDIACPATRLVGMKGMKSAKYRARIADIIRKGKRELVMAALESVYLDRSGMVRELAAISLESSSSVPATNTAGETNAPAAGVLDSILGEFMGETAAQPAVQTNNPPKQTNAAPAATDADVLNMFAESIAPAPAAQGGATGTAAVVVQSAESMSGVLGQIEKCMSSTTDNEMRFKAAMVLAKFGNTNVIPVLRKDLPTRTAAERQTVVESLGRISVNEVIPLLKDLLRDGSEDVRKAAAEACVERQGAAAMLELMLAELTAPGALLKPYEIPLNRLENMSKKVSGTWARNTLSTGKDMMLQNLALIMLENCWTRTDLEIVQKFMKSADPWQRRAALYVLGRSDQDAFKKELEWVSKDPSEYVRVVIPSIYSVESSQWIDYLDKEHFSESRYSYRSTYYGGSYNRPPRLAPEVKQVLVKLAADESIRVRLESFFCLLSRFESIDLVQFIKTVEAFPDPKVSSERVASYLTSNYENLGQGFRILVPFLEKSRYHEYGMDRVRKHFKMGSEKFEDILQIINRQDGDASVQATFTQAAEGQELNVKPQKRLLVYFTMAGCQGCESAEKVLFQLKQDFPDLVIESHNIRKLAAKQLNEAMSERFGVPENSRLVAPAIFGGAGFLVKRDITLSSLRELVVKSTWVPLAEWHDISKAALDTADKSISKRGSAIGIGIVSFAGFIDGINPCAFATIIFLLSYIQVTRRQPREIARIGLAFIMGVFAAYFLMGLGLIEIVLKAQKVLHWFRNAVNWTLAVFSLVIMVLSIRDGILCLRGRLEDMTLQLPGMLKDGIHGVIRTGSRQAHFVIAAFVVGVIISVLELACTGQVYLPTIGYMLDTEGKTFSAVGYLLIYNVAFIVPLFVVFLVACFGLTSGRLTDFLKKHAALVKFGTALLFLALFIYFVFDKVKAYLTS